MEPQINGDVHVFLGRDGFQHAPGRGGCPDSTAWVLDLAERGAFPCLLMLPPEVTPGRVRPATRTEAPGGRYRQAGSGALVQVCSAGSQAWREQSH
jgi:hypothetical protein